MTCEFCLVIRRFYLMDKLRLNIECNTFYYLKINLIIHCEIFY